MRKSTLIALLLLFLALGTMMFVADSMLGSLASIAEVGKRLTRQFEERGELAPGARVAVAKLKPDASLPGMGLLVELRPSPGVLARRGGLRALARAVASAAAEGLSADGGVRRVRVRFQLPESVERECIVPRGMDGELGEPEPPLPERWPEGGPGGAPAGAPVVPPR